MAMLLKNITKDDSNYLLTFKIVKISRCTLNSLHTRTVIPPRILSTGDSEDVFKVSCKTC